MPPRKRRHSLASEDSGIVKEKESSETDKQCKGITKVQDGLVPERRLTARQQSKQNAAAAQADLGSTENSEMTVATESMSTGKQPTRCSTRVVKRPKRDLSPPESPVKKAGKKPQQSAASSSTPETKVKRPWELWSVEDKDSFFEGLCEYGKDFESIQNLIVNKCKKKGSVMPITAKNKEQVRHFYYRTWHKISKLIQPVEDLKKDITELYGLISYSVLRKKLRGGVNPNDKNWQKINELVHQGVSTIKVKGKRIRVKMPACSALKKLYNTEESKKDPGPKIPEKIRVEFRPKSNVAWRHVQDLSQNPRLRMVVKPERNFQSLIKFLSQKWKPQRLKNKETLNEGEVCKQEFCVYPDRGSILRCVDMNPVEEPVHHFSLNKHSKDALSISPTSNKRKKDVCPSGQQTAVNIIEARAVILNNGENNIDTTDSVCKSCVSPTPGKCTVKCDMDSCVESGKDSGISDQNGSCSVSLFRRISESERIGDLDTASSNESNLHINPLPLKIEVRNENVVDHSTQIVGNPEISAIMNGDNAMFPDLGLMKETGSDVSDTSPAGIVPELSETPTKSEKSEIDSPSKIDSNSPKVVLSHDITGEEVEASINQINNVLNSSLREKQEKCKKMIDNGLKVDPLDQTTLAELYLMFGYNGELKFEYEWVVVKQSVDVLQEKFLSIMDNQLRRLSHIATVEFTDFTKSPGAGTSCQLCGQVQGLSRKGRGKDRMSPSGKGRIKKTGKDVAIQTHPVDINKEMRLVPKPISAANKTMDGVFRVPVLLPHVQNKNPLNPSQTDLIPKVQNTYKPMMRPRKLKSVNRGRTASIVQRTILPKHQLVTIYPLIPGGQATGQNDATSDTDGASETIIGHPIKGIQTPNQGTNVVPALQVTAESLGDPPSVLDTGQTTGVVEMSLSPEGDQTLMRIPASHIGTMSPKSLKAAGLSTLKLPVCVITTDVKPTVTSSSSVLSPIATTIKPSLSPPNLSSLLDLSFQSQSNDPSKFMDLVTDTNFSSILDDNSKSGIPLDVGLTTPPIRVVQDRPQTPNHSPPVRSLFKPSPAPEPQWLNGDVQDLSLSSLFESPSKSSVSYQSAPIFNNTLPQSLFNESSRDSQTHKLDVDTTLHCMMNESSIDYVKKFQDLAEQIVQGDNKGPSLKS